MGVLRELLGISSISTGINGTDKRCQSCLRKDKPAIRTVQTPYGPKRYCKQCANAVGVRPSPNKARKKK